MIKIKNLKPNETKYLKPLLQKLMAYHGDLQKVRLDTLHTGIFKAKLANCLIAWHGNKPIGFVVTFDRMNFVNGYRVCHIDLMFVSEKYRGQSIGKALVIQTCKNALKRKCAKVTVSAVITNKGSNKFYKNIGFEKQKPHSHKYAISNKALTELTAN